MINKIYVFGIDRAGKTVLINYLTKGTIDKTFKPTLNFNSKTMIVRNLRSAVWDTPGQKKFRKMWLRNVANSKVLVFVLDTGDPDRFAEAKDELVNFLRDLENISAPLIFCYSKMDMDPTKKNKKIAEKLFDLPNLYEHQIYSLETSIEDTPTLDSLKEMVMSILEDKPMEEYLIKK
jgi:small GTP-binding protein